MRHMAFTVYCVLVRFFSAQHSILWAIHSWRIDHQMWYNLNNTLQTVSISGWYWPDAKHISLTPA